MLREHTILKEVSDKLLQIYEPMRKHYRDIRKARRGITVTAQNLQTIHQTPITTTIIPQTTSPQFIIPAISLEYQ